MPTLTLTLPAGRAIGIAAFSTIATNVDSRTILPTANAGFFAGPFRIPYSFEPSRPSSLTVFIARGAGVFTPGDGVAINVAGSVCAPAAAASTFNLTTIFPAPTTWPVDVIEPVLIDIDANVFEPGDTIGLQVIRQGLNTGDTFPLNVLIAASVDLNFRQRCQAVCCP